VACSGVNFTFTFTSFPSANIRYPTGGLQNMDNPSDKEASLHKPHEAAALAVHTASTEIMF
jgi:hypothetical protein